jgi:glucose-1-phosphate cytidylyltransferase
MKVVILAGGKGTRLQEETTLKPKPMVEIGGRPILWHIMKIYAAAGFEEFVLALGYKGELIKDYFLHYHEHRSSLTVQLHSGEVQLHDGPREDWTVHLLDTGEETLTGGRVRRAAQFIGQERFLLTYGDGVANVNLPALLAFHEQQRALVTLTVVRPPARFGGVTLAGDRVACFEEKPQIGEGWINGGFFVIEPQVLDWLEDDTTSFEYDTLPRLAAAGQLAAYRHEGFWQCMDTLRDVQLLEHLWAQGKAPWKVWAE